MNVAAHGQSEDDVELVDVSYDQEAMLRLCFDDNFVRYSFSFCGSLRGW